MEGITMRRDSALALALSLTTMLAASAVSIAQEPASSANLNADQLVEQVGARCRVWLDQPGPELKSLRYKFHLSGDERVVELSPDGRRVRRGMWQGATLYTGLHALAGAPGAFTAAAERIEQDAAYSTPFIRLTLRPKDSEHAFRLEVGNGIDGSWRGYFVHSSSEMQLDLGPETLLPARELHQHSQFEFRDWQEVKPGAWAPRLVVVTRGDMAYRMHFAWQGGAAWLLTHAEIIDGDRVRPVAQVSDVRVNDEAITVALSAEQQELDAARKVVRDMLARNAAWLAPRPSFESLQYAYHTERQDVTEACVVLRDGFTVIEVARDGQGKMAEQLGDRKIVLADGRYAAAARDDARAAVREVTPERNKPNYALQLRRYVLTGCQFDLPLFELGRVLDDAMIEVTDGEWNGVPCHVATITMPGRAGYLGCGVMMGFTSWSYVHHLYPEYEVVYIDKERLVPVHETLVTSGGERRFEIDFGDYAEVADANGQLAPKTIDIVAADYFTCRYEFQLLDERHWLLKTAESWFDPAEKARGVVADVRIDEPSELAEAAQQQVSAYRDVFESPADAAEASAATRPVQTLPFRLGHPVAIGPARVVFTLAANEHLMLQCSAPAEANGLAPGDEVRVVLLDDADRVLHATAAKFVAESANLTATASLGWSWSLGSAARFVIDGLGDLSSLPGAKARQLRIVRPNDGAAPRVVQGIADASDKTRLVDVAVNRRGDGSSAVVVRFASQDELNEFQLTASIAAFDDAGELLAAASKVDRLRVEQEIVEDAWEIDLPAGVQADQMAEVAVGLSRGHTLSAPMGSLWGSFGDLPGPFSLEQRLAAADPAGWPAALSMLDDVLKETLGHGLLDRMHDWREQQAEHTTPADRLRPHVDRLLEIVNAAPEPATLAAAIRLLGYSEDARALDPARELLDHDDETVRDAAAIALGLLRNDEGLARLDEILSRSVPSEQHAAWLLRYNVWRDAMIALATIRSDASIPVVEKWMQSYIDGSELLDQKNGGYQLAGTSFLAQQWAQLLGRLPDPRYVAILTAALERVESRALPTVPAQTELLESILNYGPAALEFIEPRVRRGDAATVNAVEESHDESYIDAVRAMLATSDDLNAWSSAIDYLWNRDAPDALEGLRQAFDRGVPTGSQQEATRLRLAAALAYRGDPRGLPAAFDVLVRLAEPGEPPEDEKARRNWEDDIDDRRDEALRVFDRAPTAAVNEFLSARADAADAATRLALLAVLEPMHAIPAGVQPRVLQWAEDESNANVSRQAERLLLRRR
jgi:HEAT repeat protein